MKLLFLTPYPPYPPRSGGALRMFHLIRELSSTHHITCLSFAPSIAAVAALDPLRAYTGLVTVLGPEPRSVQRRAWQLMSSSQPDMVHRNSSTAYAGALRYLLRKQHFDIVQAESIEMAQFGLIAHERPPAERPRLVLDQFNAEYLLQRRTAFSDLRRPRSMRALIGGLYSLVQWQRLAAYERRMLRRYDCVLAVSSEDRIALQRLLPTAMIPVIPNGVDMRAFARTRPLPGGSTLIFVGTLDYRPNIDALTWFADEILPLIRSQQPQVTVQIVGRNAAPAVQALAEYEGIELVGEVDDVRPYLEAAAVYVLPMRIGGGVRLKLLEAFAMHVPVVSTSLGAEGVEGLQAGEQALIADNPSHFAAAVLQLLADRAAATRLSVAARSLAATYNWAVIAPRLANQYRELHSS